MRDKTSTLEDSTEAIVAKMVTTMTTITLSDRKPLVVVGLHRRIHGGDYMLIFGLGELLPV